MRSRAQALAVRTQPLAFRPELIALFDALGVTLGRGRPYFRVRKWLCSPKDLRSMWGAGFARPVDLFRSRYLFLADTHGQNRWFLPRDRKFLKVSAFDREAGTKAVRWSHEEDVTHNEVSQRAFEEAGISVPQTSYSVAERRADEALVAPLGGPTATRSQTAEAFLQMAQRPILRRGELSVRQLVQDAATAIAQVDDNVSKLLHLRLERFSRRARRAVVPLTFVHGDASPGNLCLRSDGALVLIDFDKCMTANAAFDLAHLFQSGDLELEELAAGAIALLGPDVEALGSGEVLPLTRLLFAADVAKSLARLGAQSFRTDADRQCNYSTRLLSNALGA